MEDRSKKGLQEADAEPSVANIAYISWSSSVLRCACPLASFGSHDPQAVVARLVCVRPPRADLEVGLENEPSIKNCIALVIRGGCSFYRKAIRVQKAGAIAMILANTDRDDPHAAFEMDIEEGVENSITIPCMMMPLYHVRDLLKQYPPSVSTGSLTLEIFRDDRKFEVISTGNNNVQKPQYDKHDLGSLGWGEVLARKTSSLIRYFDHPNSEYQEPDPEPMQTARNKNIALKSPTQSLKYTFVQWANSVDTYRIFFAPLAEFSPMKENDILEGDFVISNPVLADSDAIKNAEKVRNSITLVKRGSCTFPEKIERMQKCYSLAVIVGNNDVQDPKAAFMMTVDQIPVDHISVPAVMVSYNVLQLLITEKPRKIRILSLSSASAAALLQSEQDSISLKDVCMPGTGSKISALCMACRNGDIKLCGELLCASDARNLVRDRDEYHMTALHHACMGGHDRIVQLLLAKGAKVTALDLSKHTPLHLAALAIAPRCICLLLSVQDSIGRAGIPLACLQDLGGSTALHYAAYSGSVDCVEILLTACALPSNNKISGLQDNEFIFHGVDIQDADNCTALHVACMNVRLDCALYLIAANANVNIFDSQQRTPLQISCHYINDPKHSIASQKIAERLISTGANVHEDCANSELVLDQIQSKSVKRELEVAYFRRQMREQSCIIRALQMQMEGIQKQSEQMQSELQQLRSSKVQSQCIKAGEDQKYRSDKRVLFPSSWGNSESEEIESSEQVRAQEAALLRDIGKKYVRERRYSLAISQYEKSLELFALPGVGDLLQQANKKERDDIQGRKEIPVSMDLFQCFEAAEKVAKKHDEMLAMHKIQQSLMRFILKIRKKKQSAVLIQRAYRLKSVRKLSS